MNASRTCLQQVKCTAWLTWTVAGGTLLNLYSRFRLPRVVHAESLLQIPWACWLLGGGIRGIAFAAFIVIFRLRIELCLNRGSQHVELLSCKHANVLKGLSPCPFISWTTPSGTCKWPSFLLHTYGWFRGLLLARNSLLGPHCSM